MIAYFDTSAVIPLIINEPTSPACRRLWNAAEHVTSSRLLHPEARAALAQATRIGWLPQGQLGVAVEALLELSRSVEFVELTTPLALAAGEDAQRHGLRGYDAVHLASVRLWRGDEVVFVSGDHRLTAAAETVGMSVARLPTA